MEKLNQQNLDELFAQLVHKALEDATKEEPRDADGKVIINFNPNQSELILLMIYLLRDIRQNREESIQADDLNKDESHRTEPSNEEIQQLMEIVESLQQKNLDLLTKLENNK